MLKEVKGDDELRMQLLDCLAKMNEWNAVAWLQGAVVTCWQSPYTTILSVEIYLDTDFCDDEGERTERVWEALRELKRPYSIGSVWIGYKRHLQDDVQRTETEQGLNNCFFRTEKTILHDEVRFRSPPEIAVYDELKRRKLLFFPNAAAILGGTNEKREPDFLICHNGKWGILEVMGETYHTNAIKDHDRARLFKQHGLLCIEFFPAKRCQTEPASVVDQFLALLAQH